jgi:hypothetical protein
MSKPRDLLATLLGVRVARALHGRWRRLSATERDHLSPLADDVRERALDLRGTGDPETAARELAQANEKLADALVESAEANPEVTHAEVLHLREDLTRELERLVEGDIAASQLGPPADPAPAGQVPSPPHR